MLSAFSTTMFAFAGATSFPTIQSDMKDRRQFFTAVLIAMAGKQGVTKRCRLSWLTNRALGYEPKCGGGGVLLLCQWVKLYTGAQINFGELTLYFTFAGNIFCHSTNSSMHILFVYTIFLCWGLCVLYVPMAGVNYYILGSREGLAWPNWIVLYNFVCRFTSLKVLSSKMDPAESRLIR